jgi:hypothetical protein
MYLLSEGYENVMHERSAPMCYSCRCATVKVQIYETNCHSMLQALSYFMLLLLLLLLLASSTIATSPHIIFIVADDMVSAKTAWILPQVSKVNKHQLH